MTYELGNEGRGTGDEGSGGTKRMGKRAISLAVPQLPTPFPFLSYHYHHCTIAHTVPDDLTTSGWNKVSNLLLTFNSLLTAQ